MLRSCFSFVLCLGHRDVFPCPVLSWCTFSFLRAPVCPALGFRAAETIGCRVHGITLSKEQMALAEEKVRGA